MIAFLNRVMLLLTLAMGASAAHAFEVCEADSDYKIYVGNGVLTTPTGLIANMKAAQDLVGDVYNEHRIVWRGAYNHTAGKNDLIESIDQLIGDLSGSYSWSNFIAGLFWIGESSTPLLNLNSYDTFIEARSSWQSDLDRHVGLYQGAYDRGDMVLTISHSQGNWFALEAYERLKETTSREDGKGYGVYHVATPASRVAGDVDAGILNDSVASRNYYLTNEVDFINLVPGNLDANIGLNTEFFDPIEEVLLDCAFCNPDVALSVQAHAFNRYAMGSTSGALRSGILASLDRLEPPPCDTPAPSGNWLRVDHSLSRECGAGIFEGPVEFLNYNGEFANVGIKLCGSADPTTCVQRYNFLTRPEVEGFINDSVPNDFNGCDSVNFQCHTINSTAAMESDPDFEPPEITEVEVLLSPGGEGVNEGYCAARGATETMPDLYVLSRQWIRVESPVEGIEWISSE